jgi:hypothetical protein
MVASKRPDIKDWFSIIINNCFRRVFSCMSIIIRHKCYIRYKSSNNSYWLLPDVSSSYYNIALHLLINRRNYTFQSFVSQGHAEQCYSTASTGLITYVQTASPSGYTTTSSRVSTPSAVFAVQINAYLFATPTPISSSATLSSPTSQTLTLSTSTNTSTSTSVVTVNKGLSSAAKIGIGVGIGIAAVAVIGVIAGLFLRRRLRQRTTSHLEPHSTHPLELGTDSTTAAVKAETSMNMQEIGYGREPQELENKGAYYEMPTENYRRG